MCRQPHLHNKTGNAKRLALGAARKPGSCSGPSLGVPMDPACADILKWAARSKPHRWVMFRQLFKLSQAHFEGPPGRP